ncbi:hypothetical protein [Methylocaldum sp.]|uniref:hypothetical protein n=1 Tax=Methylocaldum sp. TaxID=1969727 RepID=UPI002D283D04|nr:hypothetical protein [Methylocaldum sp.]HYE36126.1 hypothetical protein [Methylocaldum sp.]
MSIKIPVRADISNIKNDLRELTEEADKVSRALSGKRPQINVDQAKEALKQLWEEANRIENKLKKLPVNIQTEFVARDLTRAREEAEKLAEAIHGDKTNSAYSRATRDARELETAITRIVHQQRQFSDLLREVARTGSGVAGAAIPGFNQIAGTASRFAGSGSGMSMFGKGIVGAGVGAVAYGAYKVASHIPQAENEAMGTSTLRNTIGALTGEFAVLRDAARAVSHGLGVTGTEMLGFERQYARIAGGRGVTALTGETAEAIKIARAMGLDPSEGVSFFGQAQRFRAAGSDEQSQRRFAMLIGEAVARVGFAQSSEVLQAVAGFMGASARSIVGPAAGTDAFASTLAKLTGPGSVYGADVGGGASLMARMAAGFQSGFAGAGPAGQAFALGVLQSEYSRQFSGVDVAGIMQAGPFASLTDAIGPGSVTYRSNDAATQARYAALLKDAGSKADSPMMDFFIRQIEAQTPAALVNDAMARTFDVSEREAAAYRVAMREHGGTSGIQARLADMGVNVSDPVQTINLAKYLGADRDSLMREAARFTKEGIGTGSLQSAMAGDDVEKLHAEVTKIASTQDLKDDGEKTRDRLASIETVLSEFASKLLPAQERIQQAILFSAGKTGSQFQKWIQDNDPEIMAAQSVIDEKSAQVAEEGRYARFGRWGTGAGRPNTTIEQDANLHRNMMIHREELEQAQTRKNRRLTELKAAQVTPSEAAAIRSAAKKYGVPESWFYKEMALENSGANAVSPAGARGRFQLMPGNLLPGEDPTRIETSADAMGRVFRDAMKRYGDNEDAVFGYVNGGRRAGNAVRDGLPIPFKETRNYLNRLHKIDDALPAEHKRGAGSDNLSMHTFHGEFTLRDSQGREIADPIQVSSRYSLPNAGLA